MPDEIVVTLPRLDAEQVAARIARLTVAYFSEPENVAGLSGSLLLLLAIFRGRHAPFPAMLIVSCMGQAGGRMAYRSYKNLEILAQAASGQVPDVSTVRDEYSQPDPG